MLTYESFSGKGNVAPKFKEFSKALSDAGIIAPKESLPKQYVQGYVFALKATNLVTGKYFFTLVYVPTNETLDFIHNFRRLIGTGNGGDLVDLQLESVFDCDVTKCKNGKIRSRRSKDLFSIANQAPAPVNNQGSFYEYVAAHAPKLSAPQKQLTAE